MVACVAACVVPAADGYGNLTMLDVLDSMTRDAFTPSPRPTLRDWELVRVLEVAIRPMGVSLSGQRRDVRVLVHLGLLSPADVIVRLVPAQDDGAITADTAHRLSTFTRVRSGAYLVSGELPVPPDEARSPSSLLLQVIPRRADPRWSTPAIEHRVFLRSPHAQPAG